MASLDTVHPMARDHHIGARLGGLVSHLVDFVITWNRARITRNELSRLSDRDLADIGLSRSDIESL